MKHVDLLHGKGKGHCPCYVYKKKHAFDILICSTVGEKLKNLCVHVQSLRTGKYKISALSHWDENKASLEINPFTFY